MIYGVSAKIGSMAKVFLASLVVLSLCGHAAVDSFVLLPRVLLPRVLPQRCTAVRAAMAMVADVDVPPDIFIFGLGYTGLAVARAAKQQWGDACRVSGTCRTQSKADALQKIGIEAFPFDIDGAYEPLTGRALETMLRR